MKIIPKHYQKIVKSSKSEDTNKGSISFMQKKERRLSAGIYALIVIVTIVLMLILFNILIKT
jgi:hypothetical protein